MLPDLDGLPHVARSAEGLGVRLEPPIIDIRVDARGLVQPGNGMSVYGNPLLMFRQRRPVFLPGGKSTVPLFAIEEDHLPAGLGLTPPNDQTHMLVQPAEEMSIQEYESLLGATRPLWERILKL
jgi:hypothetical protein